MTNHLKYIDVREYARVVDIARELIERAEKAEAAIQRVRELHRPSQSTIWSHDLQQAITVTTCRCGSEQYPCPTIEALDGAYSFWINHAKTGGWGRALTVAQVLKALDSDQ